MREHLIGGEHRQPVAAINRLIIARGLGRDEEQL